MNTIRIEAEDLTLSTYQRETRNIASGGEVISLLGNPAGAQGSATSTFTGVTGTYNVVVGYYDENDGQSTLSLQVGNDQSTWILDQNLGNGGVTNGTFVRRTALNSVTLINGEAITLTGNVNAAEFARVDYIEFIPVAGPTAIAGSNNNDNLNGTSDDNTINALGGNDTIKAGAGNNLIDGGVGNDTISYDYAVAGVTVNLSTGTAARKFTTFIDRSKKILALGDSNTRGFPNLADNGGYRTQLWNNLSPNFNLDFIGRLASGPGTIDRNHEGRGGATIDELTNGGVPVFEQPTGVTPPNYGNIEAALAGNPDVVLLMAGTNDILAGDSANTALAKLDTLVGRIRAALPNTHILVASLIPNTSTTVTQAVTAEFSRRVAGEVVNPRATAGQKVSFVDIFNTPGLLPSDFQTDGIHLTTSGYNKISSVWQAGILNLNDGQDTLRNIENVTGSDFNDTLTGNTGANVLVGLGGNDILRGGGGSDTLTGGVGSDIFVLETDAATDIFTDFSLDQGDLIGLSGSVQFADLSFAGSNILQGGQTLATLLGFDTTTLTVNNFTQMA
ncbi:MAG: GDSL-type esterase/lipase family protein [Thermosynechococcaceae cyanobacterium]